MAKPQNKPVIVKHLAKTLQVHATAANRNTVARAFESAFTAALYRRTTSAFLAAGVLTSPVPSYEDAVAVP